MFGETAAAKCPLDESASRTVRSAKRLLRNVPLDESASRTVRSAKRLLRNVPLVLEGYRFAAKRQAVARIGVLAAKRQAVARIGVLW